MKKNSIFVIALAVIAVVILAIFAPKDGSFGFRAGGGTSLKDLNQKDTVTTSVKLTLQANQTTEQNLEQALIAVNYFNRYKGFFIGGSMVGGVSTEFGVCTPVLFLNAGADFTNSRIEYMVGQFKRTSLVSPGLDPQYSNFCTVLGEGSSATNAMQLAFITGKTKFGFGHQGGDSFYGFNDGKWYAFAETPILKCLSLAGGIDYDYDLTGYVAAKLYANNNSFVVTGNKLGTENQNVVLTYNRSNISVWGQNMMMSASAWAKKAEQGFHLVAGLAYGKGTFFTQVGSMVCENQIDPYFGIGTSFTF